MSLILNIETATPVLSLALAKDGKVLESRMNDTQNSHAENITVFIEEMMKAAGKSFDDLDAVAVSKGPGSYTGLRIGVSTAKGICYAKEIPLIAISTLQSMAYGLAKEDVGAEALFCPMIDARRMEVYDAVYDKDNKMLRDVEATIVDEKTYQALLEKKKVVFGGNGAGKCKEVITSENAIFVDGFHPSAGDMAPLSEQAFQEEKFEDVAYFEPFYLKAYVAGKPKVKGLYS
jgi:tRNA threonylcarbamoyladenosine biosynthesis protein TsaB